LPSEFLPSQVKEFEPASPVPVPVQTLLPEESVIVIETFDAADDSE
jgi:hypothetical protein